MSALPRRSTNVSTGILVVGGAGNLGSHIVRQLLERGEEHVSTFDLTTYKGEGHEQVTSHRGDITDGAALEEAMAGVGIVFHTASIIDIKPVPSLKMTHVNVTGTACIIAAARAARVATLIYTASLEVVSGCDENGIVRKLDGVDETVPIPAQHHLAYASTKAYAERLVLAANSADLRTCSIRPGYIMGAGCIGLRMEMLRAAQRQGYYVTARVPATISTTHAKNCALMHVMAAEQIANPQVNGHSFFCRDFEANVVEMALEAFVPTPIKPAVLPLPLAYAIAWVLDILERVLIWLYALLGWTRVTPEEVIDIRAVGMAYIDIIVSDERARKVLGFQPVVSRAECMKEAAEWCKGFYATLLANQPK